MKLFTLFAKHFHVQIAIGFDPVLVDFDGKRRISRRACGFGAGESTSRDRRSSFPAGTTLPLATRHSTPGSSSPVSALGCRSFPPIRCGIPRRRCYSTSAEPTCVTWCRPSLGIRAWQRQRVTLMSIPSGFARWSGTSGCARNFSFPVGQVRQKAERVGEIAAKAVVQLLFSTGKSFTVDGLREKLAHSPPD